MKKRKNRLSPSRFISEDNYSPSTYLRLCHRCLFLNESSRYIEKCARCESDFAEFSSTKNAEYREVDFSEEDPINEAIADFESERVNHADSSRGAEQNQDDSEEESENEEEPKKRRASPISGLSVLW